MSEWLTNFHFLRPELLLLLPLALVPVAVLRYRRRAVNTWDNLLPAEFLHALVPAYQQQNKGSGYWRWPLILTLGILALAGPSWSKQETPLVLQQQSLVIVFDLSLSMLATDQSPDRLTRARQKVHDLLSLRKEGQTGLVVFAGSSHVVSPLTEDVATLRAFLPALDPFIMPQLGSNVASGVARAVELLEQSGTPSGRILIMADDLQQSDIEKVTTTLQGTPYRLSLLALGTADGGPIPIPQRGFLKENNEIVVARPDYTAMQTLVKQTNGLFSPMTIDNQDLRQILPELTSSTSPLMRTAAAAEPMPQGANAAGEQTTNSGQWHDSGYWLALAVVPLVLWQYRQAGGMLLFVAVFLPKTAEALDWQDLWKTPDQQAMETYYSGQYANAASLFEDPLWAGTAHYKAGQYEQALASFAQENTAISHFNRGNTLVEMQRFEEALQAYDSALSINPAYQQAKDNKRKLSQWLEQQKQAQDQQQGQNTEAGDKQARQNDPQQNPEQKQNHKNQPGQANQAGQNKPSAQGEPAEYDPASGNPDYSNADHSNRDNSNRDNSNPDFSNSNRSIQSANQASADQPARADSSSLKQNQGQPRKSKNGGDETIEEDGSKLSAASADAAAAKQQAETLPAAGDMAAAGDLAAQENDAGDDPPYHSAEQQSGNLKDQQTEQWLRRIPDDPGGLLRRKFLQQYRQYGSTDNGTGSTDNGTARDESESIW